GIEARNCDRRTKRKTKSEAIGATFGAPGSTVLRTREERRSRATAATSACNMGTVIGIRSAQECNLRRSTRECLQSRRQVCTSYTAPGTSKSDCREFARARRFANDQNRL